MLRCENLMLDVPGRTLCRDVSVDLAAGEVWAVLGRNGVGKSTFVHALAGLARPPRGEVQLDGQALARLRARERARQIGIVLQVEEGPYWGTVRDYALLGRYPRASALRGYGRGDIDAADAALDALGMSQLAFRRYTTLSGGERQRARIAQVLAQSPRVYLLDEPLQHLDLAHQAHVIELFSSRARTQRAIVVIVLHEPFWIGRACTHALLLTGDGSALSGRSDDVLTRENLERAYACRLREVEHREGRWFVPDV